MKKRSKVFQILIKSFYWLLISPLLFFFAILHPWDALPEPWDSTTYLGVLTVIVFGTAILTFRSWRIHVLTVSLLLVIGGFIYALNEGFIQESPTQTDVLILERTSEILRDSTSWDQSASRTCDLDLPSYTLYCALKQASYDVKDGFRHRSPALQLIRKLISERDTEMEYAHRLADFNADPEVSLEDMHELLEKAVSLANADLAD